MSNRNDYWAYLMPRSSDLMHYGVKGMKWGVRKDRYESLRTRNLRSHIEGYDEDIKDKSFSPRAHKMLVKDRAKLYAKYNKSKDRDYERKVKANAHPSYLRTYGGWVAKGLLVGAGIGAAAGVAKMAGSARIWRGVKNISTMHINDFNRLAAKEASFNRKVDVGTRAAATVLSAQLLYTSIEQGRAVHEVRTHGSFDLKRG